MYTIYHTAQALQDASATPTERREKRQQTRLPQSGWAFSLLHHLKLVLGDAVVSILAVVMASTFIGCAFDRSGLLPGSAAERYYDVLQDAPSTGLTEDDRWTVYETPEIMVQHGYACAQAARGATQDTIGLRTYGITAIPRPYNKATVFGNGWYLQYDGEDDHEVTGLGSAIFEIKQLSLPGGRHQLRWQAGGVISDQNGDDPFSWCYYYTLIFWNTTFFDVVPTHADDTGQLVFVDSSFVDTTTALQVLPGSFEDPLRTPKAVLPQGFGFVWGGSNSTLPDYDHHLLQLAFDFGDSVFFRNSTQLGQPGLVSWLSQAIFKDNSARRDYSIGGLVSILSGQSVAVMQSPLRPPFPFTPRSSSSCPNIYNPGDKYKQIEVTVPNVPFDFAMPMLVGWDIGDICTDHHVKEIGAWIDSWEYNPDTRTLVYTVTSVFDDDGTSVPFLGSNSKGSVGNYKVHILGFNKLRALPLPPLPQPPVFNP